MTIYEDVTKKIIAAMENCQASNWDKPWFDVGDGGAINITSKKMYRGINQFLLSPGTWGTFKQWQSIEARVKKGEKASKCVFWKFFDKDEEKEKDSYAILRQYCVFHESQVEGYQPPEIEKLPEVERIEKLDNFVSATQIKVVDDRFPNRACYNPMLDFVTMPNPAQFKSIDSFYVTLFHELGHATGHKIRLNRDMTGRFGTQSYAAEELVAEMCSAYLCASLGVDSEPRKDHSEYLAGWIALLKKDSRAIFTAASKAQLASDWLLAKSRVIEEEEEEEEKEAA